MKDHQQSQHFEQLSVYMVDMCASCWKLKIQCSYTHMISNFLHTRSLIYLLFDLTPSILYVATVRDETYFLEWVMVVLEVLGGFECGIKTFMRFLFFVKIDTHFAPGLLLRSDSNLHCHIKDLTLCNCVWRGGPMDLVSIKFCLCWIWLSCCYFSLCSSSFDVIGLFSYAFALFWICMLTLVVSDEFDFVGLLWLCSWELGYWLFIGTVCW